MNSHQDTNIGTYFKADVKAINGSLNMKNPLQVLGDSNRATFF